jgi:hypothetical protein
MRYSNLGDKAFRVDALKFHVGFELFRDLLKYSFSQSMHALLRVFLEIYELNYISEGSSPTLISQHASVRVQFLHIFKLFFTDTDDDHT